MLRRSRILKKIRNSIIASLAIGLILVGSGVGYTWYMGRTPLPASSLMVAPQQKNTDSAPVHHAVVAATVPESVAVQSLTSPVAPGENASVTITTNPDSSCTITVVYDKLPAKDSGLVAKTADEFGSVTWSWTVDKAAPTGKWPATITCLRNAKTAVVVGDLVVQPKAN
jgi:hypothetical protein